jgi:hypothetical protein
MSKLERKWWFALPVLLLTVVSTFWLCWALRFPDVLTPFSFPHLLVFVISLHSFRRLYSWAIWAALLWFAPAVVGERPANS